jgi:hypothetical protein
MYTQDEVKRLSRSTKASLLEDKFLAAWVENFPQWEIPKRQWRFHKTRKWLFDFAWPDQKIAVEIQGGSFVRGAHNRGGGQAKDCEKWREAARLYWFILPFNTSDMKDPAFCAEVVAEILTGAK